MMYDTRIIIKGKVMSKAYDPKTYDENEVPMDERKYMTFHGTSFCNVTDKALIKVVGADYFSDGNCMDEDEIRRAHNLGLGEAYISTHYIDCCAVRIK